jgi:hypothetical protein
LIVAAWLRTISSAFIIATTESRSCATVSAMATCWRSSSTDPPEAGSFRTTSVCTSRTAPAVIVTV